MTFVSIGAAKSALVIGGGFYGTCIADHLARRGIATTLIERESELLLRASYSNQARLHGGYHYPRSFSTAYRSRLNLSRFTEEFHEAVVKDFTKLYAIARHNSKVSPKQFETFCELIGAPIQFAADEYWELFSRRTIAAIYVVEEFAFNASVLRNVLLSRLVAAGVDIKLDTKVSKIECGSARSKIAVHDHRGVVREVDLVCNCTYSGINHIQGLSLTQHGLKHEITEMALVELPSVLDGISVTVMDGPFFSFMPFPDRGLNTFSHVRYTPRFGWAECPGHTPNPYEMCSIARTDSLFGHMYRDALRYMPSLRGMTMRDTLIESKTVLIRNEVDDGRPILFEPQPDDPRVLSILGSKIDNIYDALIALDRYLQ